MAFSLKAIIMGLFPKAFTTQDTYKDGDGKGVFERYQELCAEEYDNNVEPFIANMAANNVSPDTALLRMLPYLEKDTGAPYLSNVEATRRKLIKYATRFEAIRGTKLAYRTLFKLFLGFDVTITEYWDVFTFDAGTFDDTSTFAFDKTRHKTYCSDYSLELTGIGSLSVDDYKAVFAIISYNEPINAHTRLVTYNGETLFPYVVLVEINADGDLTYDNIFDPDLVLSIASSGELIVSGPRAANYSINADGDLIFTA